MKEKVSILIIGPFPDPISGVSIANKVVRDVLKSEPNFSVSSIDTSYPVFDEEVGGFSIKKMFFYLRINTSLIKIFKNKIIYITPGQTFFGVLKYSSFILISSLFNKELIIHVHGNYLMEEYKSLKGMKKYIFKFLISKFTKGIVLSVSLKKNLTPFIPDNRIFCLPNFAEDYLIKENSELEKSEIRIFYLSNLMKEKGIICLLKALKKLEKNKIKYHARIAGNIAIKNSVEILELVNELDNTEYIGVVSGKNKKNLLDWGNIFVLPTFYKMEGQPISILEAMATKNVIVTTDHAGISDIFKDTINGFFVEKNNVDSIYNILSYIGLNRIEIEKIGMYNQKYFLNNFTLNNFKINLLEIFNVDK